VLRIILAAVHLVALAVGFGAVRRRAAALKEPPTGASVRRTLRADADWGIAAGLWIVTGLWRYLGGIEKGTSYYNGNHAFLGKMGLLALILALEVWPMITLIRWRAALAKGGAPEAVAVPATARRIATISNVQALLVVIMVFLAVTMARGLGVSQ
jgi:putative membrane protein